MSSQPSRLPKGGVVDRARAITFRFNGKTYRGFEGDTLASALLANGVHMVGRSFKYHRPRGILAAGAEDPAGLVQVDQDQANTSPNTRASEIEIFEGLDAMPQNCWPSLSFDLGTLNDIFAPFIPAGFYYKTFMGPPGNWMFFEPFIRKAAGLGVSPSEQDPDRYEHVNRHCDVLVIGAGPAGLMATLTAARSGARVIIAEDTAHLGGHVLSLDPQGHQIDGQLPQSWVSRVETKLANLPNVTVLKRTCAFGYYIDNFIGLIETTQDHLPPHKRDPRKTRQRLWRVRADQVVLATGALERPLVFNGNDRPGVMLAGGVRTFLYRYGVKAGENAIVFTNNSSAWEAAFDFLEAGVKVNAIIDTRAEPEQEFVAAAAERNIEVMTSATVFATEGRKRISAAIVKTLTETGGTSGEEIRIPCDLLAVSGGWSPNVALFSQSRGKLRYDDDLAGFRPAQSWQAERSVGGANGTFSLANCLAEGTAAGIEAAKASGFDAEAEAVPATEQPFALSYSLRSTWELPTGTSARQSRAFVDFQNDVTAKDLHLAVREGYRSVEHAKRYTTLGMGTDQGKTSSVNGFGILASALNKSIPEVGVTTYRQPYKPITLGGVAGQHRGALFHPRRTTPMHNRHVAAGAMFEIVGDWMRARSYPKGSENFHQAVQRESLKARQDIGMLDASTLGKIDIQGKDAREFINRIYTNAWLKLKPGHCRYGLMLNEDGMVFDDGVTACLADNHFHMTTTTGGAATVLNWLEEYHQTEWPKLDVYMTTVTEQWAVISLCGPKSDKLVKQVVDNFDPDPEAFPFMTWRDARIEGVPARVFRISFTGELSYEINVPASYGTWLWDRCMDVGKDFDITPYGTEAMHLLRAEKGFIIVGQDTDGTVTPQDLRMNWIVKKNADFIGRRSLLRADTQRKDRRQLVGLLTEDPEFVIEEGAQLIEMSVEPHPPVPMIGYVTSSYYSPNLKRSIALALVNAGGERMGGTIYVSRQGKDTVPARIAEPDFLSASGSEA